MPPLTKDEPIHLLSVSPQNVNSKVKGPEAVGEGVGGGALAGAGLGFISGLQCGPLFVICSPAGAIVGSGAGAVAGGIEGGMIALSSEEKKLMEELIQQQLGDDKLENFLSNNLTERAKQHWQLKTNDELKNLKIKKLYFRIETFRFNQYSGSELSMALLASLVMEFESGQQIVQSKKYLYSYNSPRLPVEEWLKEEGINITKYVEAGFDQISELMVASLLTPPARYNLKPLWLR